MPFRPRQKLPIADFVPCRLPRLVERENGYSELQWIDSSTIALPDSSVTDLKDCLEAGVNLKQVNTKLFTPSSVAIHLDEDAKGEDVNQDLNQTQIKE